MELLCARSPSCREPLQEDAMPSLCHEASIPPAMQQVGRHWHGGELRIRYLLQHTADKKMHKMGHRQYNIAEAVTATVRKCSVCPSSLGKEHTPPPLISTEVPCTNLTFMDFTHGS